MQVFTADHKPWWVRPTVTPVYLPWEKDETSGASRWGGICLRVNMYAMLCHACICCEDTFIEDHSQYVHLQENYFYLFPPSSSFQMLAED